jgi:nitric oxide synthase-interacting protein
VQCQISPYTTPLVSPFLLPTHPPLAKQRGGHNPFTYQESRDTLGGYGTQKARIGTDSQLSFGHCALSLTPIVDGVVSPSGTLYERSAAVEYLVKENAKLSAWRSKYEKQCEEDLQKEEQGKREEEEGKISSFVGKQSGLNAATVEGHVEKHSAARLGKLKDEGYDVSSDKEKKSR